MMSWGKPCEQCSHDDGDNECAPSQSSPPLSIKQCIRLLRRLNHSTFNHWKDQRSLCRQSKQLSLDTPVASTATKPLPVHLTLFGLPVELRTIIYKFLYADGGKSVIRQQLRSGHIRNLNFTNNVNTLLVCRQFYNEAFSFAYQYTHFCYFKNYAFNSSNTLLTQLLPHQMENLRKIAVWTNPYLLEEYFEHIPCAVQLASITVCCNFMSSRIAEAFLLARGRWIYNIANNVKSLKQFHFRTGCRVSMAKGQSIDNDCEFAADLRGVLEKGFVAKKGFSLEPFDQETGVATLHINDLGDDRPRSVELMVASVYEVGL